MLSEDQITDVWTLFKEYLDKKQIEVVAEKFIDLLADYGVNDQVFEECLGSDFDLDNAIKYYLEADYCDDDNDDEWDS